MPSQMASSLKDAGLLESGVGLPDASTVEPYAELFEKHGPYLIAILFVVITLALVPVLIRTRNADVRNVFYASFAFALLSACFGTFFWSETSPLGPGSNIKYVISYEVIDNANFLPLLAKVAPPGEWENVREYASHEDGQPNFILIMIGNAPPPLDTNAEFFITTKGAEGDPIVFCRPKEYPQRIRIVNDPDTRFRFQTYVGGNWVPLLCSKGV